MPHPYRWKGAGWQRDGGPSQLFGLPGDGHLSLALHSCLCHYLYSARFLFVSWGTPPPSLQVCAAWTWRRKYQSSEHLGHLSNFLFTRERCIDQWGQKNKVHQSDSCKNIALLQLTGNLMTVNQLECSHLIKSWGKKSTNCIILFETRTEALTNVSAVKRNPLQIPVLLNHVCNMKHMNPDSYLPWAVLIKSSELMHNKSKFLQMNSCLWHEHPSVWLSHLLKLPYSCKICHVGVPLGCARIWGSQ